MLHLLEDVGFFVIGAICGAGGWSALKAGAVSDVKALLTDAETELAKALPDAKLVFAKIEAVFAKL